MSYEKNATKFVEHFVENRNTTQKALCKSLQDFCWILPLGICSGMNLEGVDLKECSCETWVARSS